MTPAAPATSRAVQRARALVAIAGNPNTGKTTLFNRLTGGSNKVGNYPGVTVERHVGTLELPELGAIQIADVPGAYSLSARSREEEIAVRVIAGIEPFDTPELVVVVVDATQLSRNLYLVLQTIELAVPTIVALNMVDVLEERGQELDVAAMRAALGVPVVAISARRGTGMDELRRAMQHVLSARESAAPGWRWRPESTALIADIQSVERVLPDRWRGEGKDRGAALALWALLSLDEHDELDDVPAELRAAVTSRRTLAAAAGRQIDAEVIEGRYAWIDARVPTFLRELPSRGRSASERIDAVLLDPRFGTLIFLVLMGAMFQALFSWTDPAITAIEQLFAAFADAVRTAAPAGLLREFVTDGLIAGVGSVLVFLPQILLLFFLIGLMEDSGYMARVAFLMDRIMRSLGLHGRAFVPMMSGYACAVPAILATRTMERQRDRLLTMMVIPLMTCSARLPVYALMIGALFPPRSVFGVLPVQGLMMVAMYVFSTLTALVAAGVLSRTVFKGPRVPLILELPPYRWPHWRSVFRMMWERTLTFVRAAGTIILACTVVLWLLLSFPKRDGAGAASGATRPTAATAAATDDSTRDTARPVDDWRAADGKRGVDGARSVDGAQALDDARTVDAARAAEEERAAEALRASYGGRVGRAMEPWIEPLGFDWKIGIGLLGAFAAREVFVSTMGVVYGAGAGADEDSVTLRDRIRKESRADGRPVYTPLVGVSLMVFFALACQCISTLAAVYRETRTWRWPVFLFFYTTSLAWIASFVIFQGGRWLGFA